MKNWQYDTTLRDLLGVTSVGTGADAKPPSALLFADFEGPMIPDAWRIYQDTAASIAKAVMANPSKVQVHQLRPGGCGLSGHHHQPSVARRSVGR